ncbi:ABC transporter substrate-binding protein [Roseomonas eburnea]|uniref:Thiamine pyrimidine synthase n=1 Tax=Neoroseomonas eburnea TaxID=1346889 RepID=A0A9X9X9H9_9PROT|nr:ABC transporter substrate-binding protein [Neoroseomonas eburnea]MBR0680365.1 ABC transporter substrate-binding protein [Neoroseomonas eburnea]
MFAAQTPHVSRRALLAAGLFAAGATPRLSAPALAQGLKPVKLTLPWLANGSTLFTYVAKNQGFFRRRGIDVSISRGFGSVAAAQAVGSGEFDYGFVFAGGTILGAARGLPLVAMSTLGYDATMGILVRADSPVREAKDLEGRKIGIVPTSAEAPYWPAFARKTGIDAAGITMVQMDNRVLEQGLINRQVDAITAIGTSSVPVMLALRQQCRFLPWSKAGVSLYAGQVVTRRETLEKDRELSRAVTDALGEGLAFALKDPEAGIDIFLREVPEIGVTSGGRENARISQALMHYTVLSPEAQTHSLGYTDMAKAAEMVEMVMEFGAPRDARKPDVATLFSNDFAGTVKLTAAEWAQVRQNVASYAAILG